MSLRHLLPRGLPAELERLTELAFDLRCYADDSVDELWHAMNPELWVATRNPVMILESISRASLWALAGDDSFLQRLAAREHAREDYPKARTWMADTTAQDALGDVAYFSMEFGLSEALPVYTGGLAMLAGKHLKTASDLGLPLVGVGLLYQHGYFRQSLDAAGGQLVFYPFNAPLWLLVMQVRVVPGEWLCVELPLHGRTLTLQAWQIRVGRVSLYLLHRQNRFKYKATVA
jgi:starch phosphorylase